MEISKETIRNIKKIKRGDVFNSYRELCNFLGEKQKGGDSKKHQLKQWNRYFDWDKDGNKFVIKEVFDTPRPLELYYGNNKFMKDVEKVVKHSLSTVAKDKNNGILYLPNSFLLEKLNFVNDKFTKEQYRVEEVSEELNINPQVIYDVINSTRDNFTDCVKRVFNGLQKKGYLIHSEVFQIGYIDDNGEIASFYTNDDETSDILTIQLKVLEKYGYYDLSHIYLIYKSGKGKSFNDKMVKEISKYFDMDITFCRRVHKLICAKQFISEVMSLSEHKEVSKTILEKANESAKNSANNRHNNSIVKLEEQRKNTFGEIEKNRKNEILGIRSEDTYISNSNIIIYRYMK